MVFRAKGKNIYQLRVTSRDGSLDPILSCGTTDPDIARDVERMIDGFRAQRKWAWIDLIAGKKVKLAEAYDAFVSGQIEGFMATALGLESDPDIDPLITEWAKKAKPRYVQQVRALIPEGTPFRRSSFRPRVLKDLLDALDVGPNTRLKHKAALSNLAKRLLHDEILETNPVRDVELAPAPRADKALRSLRPEQAKKLVLAQDGEQRVIEALMVGSGVEWQGVERLTKGEDIDTKHRLIWAHGTKTARFGTFRDRWIEVTEDWAWAIVAAWIKPILPGAPIFTKTERRALWAHNRTAATLKLPATTLHQYRHTFAKMWIARGAVGGLRSDGRDLAWLKNQLGHAPESTLLLDTYGVEIKAFKLTEQQKARMRLEEKQG